jgi:hypothetical protein
MTQAKAPLEDHPVLMSRGLAQLASRIGTTQHARAASLRPLWCLLWMRRNNDG